MSSSSSSSLSSSSSSSSRSSSSLSQVLRYLYSGGAANVNQALSIGGVPSNKDINDGIDVIFPRVTRDQLESGGTIYRCIYILNQSMIMFDNVRLWLEQSVDDGEIEIGIIVSNEMQRLLITGTPVTGTFALQYNANVAGVLVAQITDPITWVANLPQMTINLQNALNSLGLLGGIAVQAINPDNQTWVYDITFGGINGVRNQMLLEIVDNAMIGIDLELAISTVHEGQPVNSQAPNIGFDNQPPHGVDFVLATLDDPVSVGLIEPFDIFAVWFKRTLEEGFTPELESRDSVVLNFTWEGL